MYIAQLCVVEDNKNMKKVLRIALVFTMLAAMLLCATSCAKVKLYVQVDSINSHKVGEVIWIDIHLSFEQDTSFEDIVKLKKQMQEEFDRQLGNCNVNIVVGGDGTANTAIS